MALVMALAVTAGARAADNELNFTIMRQGDEIGTHAITMTTTGAQTRVDIETEAAVKLAFITVYNFDHEGHEVWEGGRLISYNSETDDDGTDKTLRARAEGGQLVIDGSAAKSSVAPTIIPASLWNRATVSQNKLLNTLDGSEMTVAIKDLGEEMVGVRGRKVPARHYAMTGDLERDIWYDANGQLVHVRFLGSDGSEIQYVMK